eukprot:TRINITY_DN886_c0_g1_i2.p1 TRINITY_DN886_c0_g1~~TRINITY_DN886_c0_g1_i2.p1  ORF type:complete len:332 (-),score=66.55 TRINITY_DN886_c0_g1_i2:58-1053(-)
MVVQCPDGTGKTAAFAIGVLELCERHHLQALVLCPTLELARQVKVVMQDMGCYTSLDLSGSDNWQNKLNADVVVGTPDGMLKAFESGCTTSKVKLLVLDEADELVERYKNQVLAVRKLLPTQTQTCLFATTPFTPQATKTLRRLTRLPFKVQWREDNLTPDFIAHFRVQVQSDQDKIQLLRTVLKTTVRFTVVFCNSARAVAAQLDLPDPAAVPEGQRQLALALHAGQTPEQRSEALQQFELGNVNVLVTEDHAVRGLDLRLVTLSVSYDCPTSLTDYVHRASIAASYRSGMSIVFVASGAEAASLDALDAAGRVMFRPLSAAQLIALAFV